ncbi:MAG: recombinase family protein [Vulcanimicrobiaceae bacterium]
MRLRILFGRCCRDFETRSRSRKTRSSLAELRAGDTLVVWKLDQLRRSLRHLLEVAEMRRRSRGNTSATTS